MLHRARQFFEQRSILEVDTSHLTKNPPVDAHIDLLETTCSEYLLSSPELPMKRLLAQGAPDIYQLAHVFRKEETGPKHLTEFLMAEWYRRGITLEQMIDETCDFCELFIKPSKRVTLTYRSLFQERLRIDPWRTSQEELTQLLQEKNLHVPPHLSLDDLLALLLSTQIEPTFEPGSLTTIFMYPPSQAALAQTRKVGDAVMAERFEVYFTAPQGAVELANGYHEVTDGLEMLNRFIEANRERVALHKKPYPVAPSYYAQFDKMPECCGVAVGVDRLFMLAMNKETIQEVIPGSA